MAISHLISGISDGVKNTGDGVFAGLTIATFAGWLPSLAALISLVWGVLRIVEWFEKRAHRKLIEAAELAQIKAGKMVIQEKFDA